MQKIAVLECIFPPIVYALLGTSNKISIGPVALDSILIITGLSVLAQPGSDHYLELAVTLTLMVGLIQLLFGLIKFVRMAVEISSNFFGGESERVSHALDVDDQILGNPALGNFERGMRACWG